MGEWVAANWSPLLTVLMFGWLLWENRALRRDMANLRETVISIDKRLVHVETVIDERIPRRPAEVAP